MQLDEVMEKLEAWGSPQTKKVLIKHGAREPFYGVKVADLKKIVKKVKVDHELSLELYETGNSDAMYLASLISDKEKLTKEDLKRWVKSAYWSMLSECAVAWAAAESPFAEELADEWITSEDEQIAAAGWSTWASYILLTPNEDLDLDKIRMLMEKAEEGIHDRNDRVAYSKNNFIISAGGSIPSLTAEAIEAGNRIGKVKVNMGETACKVPFIPDYIGKMEERGKIGYKKKTVKC